MQDSIPSRDNRAKIYSRDDEQSKRDWSDLQDKLKITHPEDKLTYNNINNNDNNNNYEAKRGRSNFDDEPPAPPPIVYRGSSENQGSKEWFDKVDKLSDHPDRDRERDHHERQRKVYRTHNVEKDHNIANMYD